MISTKSETLQNPKSIRFDNKLGVNDYVLGLCQACSKKALLEKVAGYEAFLMCPHCAYSARIYSGDDKDYC